MRRAASAERLSESLCRALEQYEATPPESGALLDDGAVKLAGLGNRVDQLEEVVEGLGAELRDALARLDASNEELARRLSVLESGGVDGGQVAQTAASVGSSPSLGGRVEPHIRRFPELVTEVGELGEERCYGPATQLIAEWRGLCLSRDSAAHTLESLKTDERMLELELVLVGEHKLTLPPADRPWDGVRRHGELRLLWRSLQQVRRERRWAQLLHWGFRLLTLGLWGRRR